MTDVHVSIDLYANNASSVAPAVWHHPEEMISTLIRVVLPKGYDICSTGDGKYFSSLQGGPAGVKGLTGAGGFRQVVPVAKGRITTEVVPGVFERTGRQLGPADPCSPLTKCLERVFEMETFHICDETTAENGGDYDGCRPTTSRDPSVPSRLTFTISNVRNPHTRVRNPKTGVDGEMESAGRKQEVQYGVQIYKKFIEVRNEQKIPRLTMRYYNNRMNDRLLNHTTFRWFDGTSNEPVVIMPNRLWSGSMYFDAAIKSKLTTAVFNFKLASSVPQNGFIRIVFPDSIEVNEAQVKSVEVWFRVVSTTMLLSLDKVKDGFYQGTTVG